MRRATGFRVRKLHLLRYLLRSRLAVRGHSHHEGAVVPSTRKLRRGDALYSNGYTSQRDPGIDSKSWARRAASQCICRRNVCNERLRQRLCLEARIHRGSRRSVTGHPHARAALAAALTAALVTGCTGASGNHSGAVESGNAANGTITILASADKAGHHPLETSLIVARNHRVDIYLTFGNGLSHTRMSITRLVDLIAATGAPKVVDLPEGESQLRYSFEPPPGPIGHDLRLLIRLDTVPSFPAARRSFGVAGRLGSTQGPTALELAQMLCRSADSSEATVAPGIDLQIQAADASIITAKVGAFTPAAPQAVMFFEDGAQQSSTDGAPCTFLSIGQNSVSSVMVNSKASYEAVSWSVALPPTGQVALAGAASMEFSRRVITDQSTGGTLG